MFSLRNYQSDAESKIREAFSWTPSVIYCAPTGSGKTVTFSNIALSAVKRLKTVMILCDRKKLIYQAMSKLSEYGLIPTIIAPGHKMRQSYCYLASVQTLNNRELPEVDLLIIDEAHKQTFDKVLKRYKEEFPNKKMFIIGATATPIRTWKSPLTDFYGAIIETATIKGLISEGHLAPAVHYGAKMDLSKIKKTAGEYNNKSMFEHFNKKALYKGCVEKYQKHAPGTKAICFNVNVAHSKAMTMEFRRAGIPSAHVDGSMSDEQIEKIYVDFHLGKFLVLNNCDIATTGYDEPTIVTVIINRATESLALFLQMGGRGSRPCEEIGKTHFNIIDMGSNIFKHGFWDDEREWSLEPTGKRRTTVGEAPVKICINNDCKAIIHASVMKCKHCGAEQPRKKKELLDGDFSAVHREVIPDRLNKPFSMMNDVELREFSKIKGYANGWVWKQKQLRKNKG